MWFGCWPSGLEARGATWFSSQGLGLLHLCGQPARGGDVQHPAWKFLLVLWGLSSKQEVPTRQQDA